MKRLRYIALGFMLIPNVSVTMELDAEVWTFLYQVLDMVIARSTKMNPAHGVAKTVRAMKTELESNDQRVTAYCALAQQLLKKVEEDEESQKAYQAALHATQQEKEKSQTPHYTPSESVKKLWDTYGVVSGMRVAQEVEAKSCLLFNHAPEQDSDEFFRNNQNLDPASRDALYFKATLLTMAKLQQQQATAESE